MASAAETTEKPRARKDLGGGLPLRKRLGKLFTKEDPVHLHKTLGLLSLLSYLYRYFYLWPTTGALGFAEAGIRDWAGVVLHTALSSSSLIFTVIRLRILDKPTIIWEEYRLHAIVFTIRGSSVYVFHALWPAVARGGGRYGTDLQVAALFLVVMAHHILVDKITDWYGNPAETTVRGDGKRAGPKFKRLMRLYSFYQFIALAGHLTVHPLGCDNGWNPMIAVQSSAFCMTLYRKRLIRGKTHALIYSACLLLSALHIFRINDGYSYFSLKAALVYCARVQLGASKYLLWAVFSLLLMPSVQDFGAQVYDVAASQFMLYSVSAGWMPAGPNTSDIVGASNTTDPVATMGMLGYEAALPSTLLPADDGMVCRAVTLFVGTVAIMRMRKEERNYPKDQDELKKIDLERKEARLNQRRETKKTA